MENMRVLDFKRAAQQLNQTRPEEMLDMTKNIDNAMPAMKAHADAQMSNAISCAKMLKQQGNELHSGGQYIDAAAKYKLAKDNMKSIPAAAGQTLQLQCSLNLMSCYLKSAKFEECIDEGSDVLTYDLSNAKAYYRRGQAYKELGNLAAAVADFSKAHDISPEDETIAEVLRDTEGKVATEGGGSNLPKGVVIEEIVEEHNAVQSSTQRSSCTGYTVPQAHERAGNSRQPDSSESLRSDPATESQTRRTEEEEKRERDRLNNSENLFGEVVDNCKLDKMARYRGKPKMREDRAREAMILVNEDDKNDMASNYVRGLVPLFGHTVRGTLCLVYNATGDTLYQVANHDWYGRISRAPPYPTKIGNGQWAAFWHNYSSFDRGSVAAVVYRGKNKDGEDQDYLLAWRTILALAYRNKSYCEIGGVDNFQERWRSIKKKLGNSDYSSNAVSDGCGIEAKIGKGHLPKFTAIISCR